MEKMVPKRPVWSRMRFDPSTLLDIIERGDITPEILLVSSLTGSEEDLTSIEVVKNYSTSMIPWFLLSLTLRKSNCLPTYYLRAVLGYLRSC